MQTTLEWSLGFDQMWNNITSNQAPGLTEHEKSVFLTHAQENLVRDSFYPRTSPDATGFDKGEFTQSDFYSLIRSAAQTAVTAYNIYSNGVSNASSKTYALPNDLLVPLNEEIVTGSKILQVIPISFEEYRRIMSKPFHYAPKGQAWRIDAGAGSYTKPDGSESDVVRLIEIISPALSSGSKYTVRYIKKPQPIILPDEQGDTEATTTILSINGSNKVSTCLLPETTHQAILDRAIMLAKIAWSDPAALQPRTNR